MQRLKGDSRDDSGAPLPKRAAAGRAESGCSFHIARYGLDPSGKTGGGDPARSHGFAR